MRSFNKILLLTLVALLLVWPGTIQAIGVSPSTATVNDLVNGIRIEQKVNVSRSVDLDKDIAFEVKLSGEGARYLDLPNKEFTIPAGERSVDFVFYIAPQGAPNGSYKANLNILSKVGSDVKFSGSGSNIKLGAVAGVIFTIVDREVKRFEVLNLTVFPTEVGQPFFIDMYIDNTGNVDVRPDKVDVKLVDMSDETVVINFTIPKENIEIIPPSTKTTVGASLNYDIPQGKYLTSLNVFSDGKIIYKYDQGSILEVHAAGTLAQEAKMLTFKINGDSFAPGDLIKLDASIQNEGKISIRPVLYVEVTADGKIIDLLRSEEKNINQKMKSNYTLTMRPEAEGNYSLDAYFEYGSKETEHKEVTFTVFKPEVKLAFNWLWLIVGGGLLLLILVIIFVVILIKRKHRKNKVSASRAGKVKAHQHKIKPVKKKK